MSPCFECGRESHHSHHVIPFSMGGTKTVRLCERHHGMIHGIDFSQHSNLIKSALRLRIMAGIKLGRPYKMIIDQRVGAKIKSLAKRGASIRQIEMVIGASRMSIFRYLKTWRSQNERRIRV